ncbi:hypothetical protein BASA81_002639 [Batrachochytrium salamandrivorans]|nr:hypothetical protein BASA81_002639 [Batrachochytrium salamandrivorans]
MYLIATGKTPYSHSHGAPPLAKLMYTNPMFFKPKRRDTAIAEVGIGLSKESLLEVHFNPTPTDQGLVYLFQLQLPFEYLVCLRYHVCSQTGQLVGVQFQTNLGRRSRFQFHPLFDQSQQVERHELFVSQTGQCISGFTSASSPPPSSSPGSGYSISQMPIPFAKRKKLTSMLLLPTVRKLALKKPSPQTKSALGQVTRGGKKSVAARAVQHGLAGKMFSAGEDGDAMIRLLLEGEEKKSMVEFPTSILRALTDNRTNDFSLLELLCRGDSPLLQKLFGSDSITAVNPPPVIKLLFHQPDKHTPSLVQLVLAPNRVRGLRSLMQIMTDEEALDDPHRPCLMRSLLSGEEYGHRPSLLRMMLTKGKANRTIIDMLMGGQGSNPSVARLMFTETPERPISLCRAFFSDTAMGKPSLAKYAFGGETHGKGSSLLRLMVQGESRGQCSLLRLLGLETEKGAPALISLLTMNAPCSLLDVMMEGEDSAMEQSLARLMLGTTFTIQNGRIRMGKLLGQQGDGEEEGLEKPKLDRGLTVAKLCMLGEEDGGPGISIMRMVLLGEEKDGQSILRLLLTGEAMGEVSPLRILFTGMHAALVGANAVWGEMDTDLVDLALHPAQWLSVLQAVKHTVAETIVNDQAANMSWKESFDGLIALGKQRAYQHTANWRTNLAFLHTAFARIKSMGPEFAKVWTVRWLAVANEVRLTGERMGNPQSTWKQLAPEVAALVEAVAEQRWQVVIVSTAKLVQHVEKLLGGQQRTSLGRLASAIEGAWAPKWF